MVDFSIDPKLKTNASLHACLIQGNERFRQYLDGRSVYPLTIQWESVADTIDSPVVRLRFSEAGDLFQTDYPLEDLDDPERVFRRLLWTWGDLLARKSHRFVEAFRAELVDNSTSLGS